MTNSTNYYQILGLVDRQHDATISPDQVRQAYKQALLYFHPDKQNGNRIKHDGPTPSVDEISEAYRTLADPKARSEYDRKLRLEKADSEDAAATRHTGMETIDLEELDLDEDSSTWTKACRCGSVPAYVITEPELEKSAEFGELITGCKGCSLWLKVLFTVEE